MNDLMTTLQPKQKAILFAALNLLQQTTEDNLAESHLQNNNHAYRRPLDWMAKEVKEVKQLLFAESFPEDLEPLDFFIQEQKSLQPG